MFRGRLFRWEWRFNYSPFLLRAAYLPIGPQDTGIGGILLALSFFAALTLLPRPASPRENIFRLAATFSLTSFYALEQGNFDVTIFVVTIISVRMIMKKQLKRACRFIRKAHSPSLIIMPNSIN